MRSALLICLASAGTLFSAVNLNPDPNGTPWIAGDYTEPAIKPQLDMADVDRHRSPLARAAAALPSKIDHSHEL